MDALLANRVALITGGGSGIGEASCYAFARHGAAVVVAGRTRAKVEAVAATIRSQGGQAIAVAGDVSQGDDVRQMIAAASAFGGLDILYANAGISPSGSVTDISEAEWDECMAINLRGPFLCAKYALPELLKRGGGTILFTAGTFGLRAARAKAAYAAAKAGVINLARAIALDYARVGVRCNVICPGYVDTPLNEGFATELRDQFLERYQPLPGIVQPGEVAALAVFLASDAGRMITGQVHVIDAGQQAGLF